MARSFCTVLAIFILAIGARAGPSQTDFGDPAEPMVVAWAGREIRVWVRPRENEGYLQLARRVMAEPERYRDIVEYNGNRPVMLGRGVAFPFAAIKPALRGEALRALYPGDYPAERGWVHRVAYPSENLIQLAEAFTGSKAKFQALAKLNKLRNPDLLRIGTELVIPVEWIPEELNLQPLGVKAPLTLERDPATRRHYAVYTIRKNETLYSSVILRFTDREFAEEVRRMAEALVRLNGLRDVEHVPAGSKLRIPVEWIGEDYLLQRRTSRLVPPRRPAPKGQVSAAPMHVIVDPGHGGVDAGATYGSLRQGDITFEDEVVYDIALRLKRRLEALGHRAYLTIEDPNQKRPVAKLATRHDRDEVVLVTPPYRIDHVDVGINMRVYRIESIFRRLTERERVAPENVVLISIHGDALAPMLRGAMVYYPDESLRHAEFRPTGRVYRLRKEALPAYIRFRPEANEKAADLSRSFAELLMEGLRSHGVAVNRRRSIRSFYYREDRRTLPAVLRYSRVPSSVLLEVANLNNPADRRAIRDGAMRERIAKGIAAAVEQARRRQMTLAMGGPGR